MDPDGAVMTIVATGTAHVGCTVIPAVGVAGVPGIVFTVKTLAADVQPVELSLAVTLYEPGASEEKVPLAW